MWIGIIEQKQLTSGSAYIFNISTVPEFVVAGSKLQISGSITENNSGIANENLTFRVDFGFGDPSVINFSPDINGLFTVSLDVDPLLVHPANDFLTFTNTNFNQVDAVFELFTSPDSEPLYSLQVIDPIYHYGIYTFSGKAPSGTNLTLSSNILFPAPVDLIADANNDWAYEFTVDPNVPIGNYTVTLSSIYGDLDEETNVDTRSFNPVFGGLKPNAVGIETSIEPNSNTVDPHTELTFAIKHNSTTYDFQNIVADNNGSFDFNDILLPGSLAGLTVDIEFIRVFPTPSETVTFDYVLADFDSTITYDFPEPTVFIGEDYAVSATASPGYPVTLTIKQPPNLIVFQETEVTSPSGTVSLIFGLVLDGLIPNKADQIGNYEFTLSAPGHVDVTFTKFVDLGLEADMITPGLIFPGDTVQFDVNTSLNVDVFFNLFNSTFSGTSDNNGDLLQTITVPANQTPGVYAADINALHYPNIVNESFTVADPNDYGLTFDDPGLILTGDNGISFSGTLLPGKTATLTIPELGINTTFVGDILGNYNVNLALPWQPSGSYSLNVSATGENTITYSGNHRPAVKFTVASYPIKQGSSPGSLEFRADANENLTGGISNSFVNSTSILTDANGYGYLNHPEIPIDYFAITTLTAAISTNSGNLFDGIDFIITPSIPLTLAIIDNEIDNILFINTSYTVAGNKPDYDVLNLSNVGNIDSLTINNKIGTTYDATLMTSEAIGEITLFASTLYQDIVEEIFIVDYPLTISVPPSPISYNSNILIAAVTHENIVVNLRINYLNSSGSSLHSESYVQIADNAGNTTFNVFISDILDAVDIEFIANISVNYEREESREYINSLTVNVGLPPVGSLLHYSTGEVSFSRRSRNNLYLHELDLEQAGNKPRFSNVFNIVEWGSYWCAQADTDNRLYGAEPDLSPYFDSGFTVFDLICSDSNFQLFQNFSSNYYLRFTKLTAPNYEVQLRIDGVVTNYSLIWEADKWHDLAWVFNKNDINNNNNSSFQLYLDGVQIFNYQINYVFSFAASVTTQHLRNVKSLGNGSYTYTANNGIIYTKPLIDTEVADHYSNGIRKKSRACNFEDVARNHYYSFFPTDNGEYGLRIQINGRQYINGTTAQDTRYITQTLTNSTQVVQNVTVGTDSENRKYFNLNGFNQRLRYSGFFNHHRQHYLIFRRKNLTSIAQTLIHYRTSIFKTKIQFTDTNTIELSYFTSQSSTNYRKKVYQDSLIANTNISCLFIQSSATNSNLDINIRLQGQSLTPISITDINNPGDLGSNNSITIGANEPSGGSDFAAIEFYGLLTFLPLYSLVSTGNNFLVPLNDSNDESLLISYIFWLLGFKEALQHSHSNFPLLAQNGGKYYL